MILKWLNENFGQTRTILFHEADLMVMINVMNNSAVDHYHIGCCGLSKVPECWYVEFQCFERNYWKIVKAMAKEEIEMFPDTILYRTFKR